MSEPPLRKLDAAAVGRCATIAGIQRRDDFDAVLPKLSTMAWAIAGRPYGATREKAARAKILKTGKAFVRAVHEAPFQVSSPIQLGLPFGVTSLAILIDEVESRRPEMRFSSVGRRDQFVVMLFITVEKLGGTLNLSKLAKLLDELKPYLPNKFLGSITPNNLRRLREKAKHYSRNAPWSAPKS